MVEHINVNLWFKFYYHFFSQPVRSFLSLSLSHRRSRSRPSGHVYSFLLYLVHINYCANNSRCHFTSIFSPSFISLRVDCFSEDIFHTDVCQPCSTVLSRSKRDSPSLAGSDSSDFSKGRQNIRLDRTHRNQESDRESTDTSCTSISPVMIKHHILTQSA